MNTRILPFAALAVLLSSFAVAVFYFPVVSEQKPAHEPKLLPSEWVWKQRAFPHGEIRSESVRLGIDQAREKEQQATTLSLRQDKSSNMTATWQQRGPTNIGGRIADIAVHPTNEMIAYAATATGGLFKTTDGGTDWDPVFDQGDVLTCGAVAVDPQNPDTVWLGTGEANAISYSVFGQGIYRSDDAGQTWQNKGLADGRYIARIAVDPTDSDRVFSAVTGKIFGTGNNRGIYRTTNGGDSWDKVFALTDSTAATDLAINPDNPDIIYAAMWERTRGLNYRTSGGPTSGIYRSTDGGDTWNELTLGLPSGIRGRIGISLCTSQPNVLYAVYVGADAQYQGVYKTTNGGNTWTSVGTSALNGIHSSFGWYFGNIRVNPANPDHAYVLGLYNYRTTNGGNSWSEVGSNMHVDHHAMAFAPSNPNRVYEGNDGGLYISTNGGSNFTKVNNQPTSQFYAVEVDYQNPDHLYGGTQDNGTWRTTDGSIDNYEHILGGDGFRCLVDPTNSSVIFAESQNGGLRKSTNGGSWFNYTMNGVDGSDRINWSMPYVMDPNNPQIMYLGTHRIYKSTDQGDSWASWSEDLTNGDQGAGFGTITTIAVAPTNSSSIVVGTDDGHVWRYSPFNFGWIDISGDLPTRWVTRVAFDPNNHNNIYATFSGLRWDEDEGHVFKSTNAGTTWQDISGDLPDAPVNVVIVDPENSNLVMVGSDVGCYYTTNEGQSWQMLGLELPHVPVFDMVFHAPTRMLVAGTHGRSMFSMELPTVSAVPDQDTTPGIAGLKIRNYPNPFNPRTTIAYEMPKEGLAIVEILDMRGRLVRSLNMGILPAGSGTFSWDGKDNHGHDSASGIYFTRFQSEDQETRHKMTLVR
ncbi:MAG: T9SS type A sorting domain-containing protein [bacterium]|nr:T9SS type A sorting domain-containing protein [bacterium]